MSVPTAATPSNITWPRVGEWFTIERQLDDPPRTVLDWLPTSGWAVYVLRGGNRVLYVGLTRKPRERLQSHAKLSTSPVWSKVTHVLLYRAETELVARQLEVLLHDELRPERSRVTGMDRAELRRQLAAA